VTRAIAYNEFLMSIECEVGWLWYKVQGSRPPSDSSLVDCEQNQPFVPHMTRDTMDYATLALAVLAAYYIIRSIKAWYRLRHFQGPFLASFSYLWMVRTVTSGHAWKIHLDNSEKYGGPFVRIRLDVLITDSAEMIRRMNAARSPYRRDGWYDAFLTNPYSCAMVAPIKSSTAI